MSFLALKALKLGYSQAKKHNAKKQQQQQQEQFQQGYPVPYPESYPMTEYPPGMTPGANVHYPPPGSPGPTSTESTSKSTKLASMFISAFRLLQFVLGLTVMGLYGRDVHNNSEEEEQPWHTKFYFALVTSTLATITAIMYLLVPCCLRRVNSASGQAVKLPQCVWELVLCILWLTMFGIFGKMFLVVYAASESGSGMRDESSSSTSNFSSNGTAGSSASSGLDNAAIVDRMRHAVWVDLANLALWVITASSLLLRWLKGRRAAGSAGSAGEKA